MNLQNYNFSVIGEVKQESNTRRANLMLTQGWVLLKVVEWRAEDQSYTVFVLDKPKVGSVPTAADHEYDQRNG